LEARKPKNARSQPVLSAARPAVAQGLYGTLVFALARTLLVRRRTLSG